MNTPHALDIIENGNVQYGDKFKIGAGTVLTLDEAKDAIEKGAKFMLSPIEFTDDIFAYAKAHKVITVPAAMSPTEVHTMFDKGADIVKIFPATTVGSGFFKTIQALLEKLPLMAVGGVSLKNVKDLLTHGTSYLGIRSNMFNQEDLINRDIAGLAASLQAFVDIKNTL